VTRPAGPAAARKGQDRAPMPARPLPAGRVPAGPVQAPPPGFLPEAERARILAAALAGIELGAWDRRILHWISSWDPATVLTVASWITRTRGHQARTTTAVTASRPGATEGQSVRRPAPDYNTTHPDAT